MFRNALRNFTILLGILWPASGLAFTSGVGTVTPNEVLQTTAPTSVTIHGGGFEPGSKVSLLHGGPFLLGSVSFTDSGPAEAVRVRGRYAYVAGGSSGLRVVDVADPANPLPLGAYDLGGGQIADGVFLAGNYAYVVSRDADHKSSGLRIIDVTEPSHPVLIGSVDTEEAYDVFVVDDFAYLATRDGLVVVYVKNPSTPAVVGSYKEASIAPAYGVDVVGNVAYLSTYSSANLDGKLYVIDVSDPSLPALIGSFDAGGASGVAVSGAYAYVARGMAGLAVVDVGNPRSPLLVGTFSTGDFAAKVRVEGNYVYCACAGSGVFVIDVRDQAHPFLTALHGNRSAGEARDVFVLDGRAYVVGGTTSGFLEILDVSAPESPPFAGWYDTVGEAWGVFVSGGLAYVTDREWGLNIASVADPSMPAHVGSCAPSAFGTPEDVAVEGGVAYVAGGQSGGLDLVDVQDPANPKLLGNIPGSVYGIAASGTYAYLAAGSHVLQIYDVSDPAKPVPAPGADGLDSPGSFASGVFVSEGYAYVADVNLPGLLVVDVADPAHPTLWGSYTSPGPVQHLARGVYVSDWYAYVVGTHGTGGDEGFLDIVDVRNPANPVLVRAYTLEKTARRVTVSGNKAYVATESPAGLVVVDVSDKAAPYLSGSYNTGSALGVSLSGEYAFTANLKEGVSIVHLDSEVSDVKVVGADTMTATFPDGLGPGYYDALVTTPAGAELIYRNSFKVLPPDEVEITQGPTASPSTVNVGELTKLSVWARDMRHVSLNYAWTASCPGDAGSGTFGDAAAARTTTWTPPRDFAGNELACALTVAVNDGPGGLTKTAYVMVNVVRQQVDPPMFDPPPTNIYPAAQAVRITSKTPGATIRYTTDGSEPTSTEGTTLADGEAVAVLKTTTLKAIAFKAGMVDSTVASATYRIEVGAPTFKEDKPAYLGEFYCGTTTVTLSTGTPDATIWYTTDGTDPSPGHGTELASGGTVEVSEATTLRAIAVSASMGASAVVSKTYRISVVCASPVPGNFFQPIVVTMSATWPDATLRYTTDGTTPTSTHGTELASGGTVEVSKTTTLLTIAVSASRGESGVYTGTYTFDVAPPTFSPPPGIYSEAQTVTLSATWPGATIWYTTDGTDPSPGHGTELASGGTVDVSHTTTLAAVAVNADGVASSVASASYKIAAKAPAFSPLGGTYFDAQWVTLSTVTPGATLRYTTDGSTPSSTHGTELASGGRVEVSQTTTLNALALREGMDDSDVVSAIYSIEARPPTFSPPDGTFFETATVTLSTATPDATIRYTTDGSAPTSTHGTRLPSGGTVTVSGTTTLKAVAVKTGWADSVAGSATYTMEARQPTFGPLPPGTYFDGLPVTVSTATPDATILYTTDGSKPTSTHGTPLASGGTFTVSQPTTLRAIAVRTGMEDSVEAYGTYTVEVVSPTFDLPEGTYSKAQVVKLSAPETPGATIRYTTDGSKPMSDWTVLGSEGEVPIDVTTTLTAVAERADLPASAAVTASYVLEPVPPIIDPPGGSYDAESQPVTITGTGSGETIRYTTDGSDPAILGTELASGGTIEVNRTTTLKAVTVRAGWTYSPRSTATAGFYFHAAVPTFDPAGGVFASPQHVTITCATPGVTIYYTTDGSEPTPASLLTLHSGESLLVDTAIDLKAIAYREGWEASAVQEAGFGVLTLDPPPKVSPRSNDNSSSKWGCFVDTAGGHVGEPGWRTGLAAAFFIVATLRWTRARRRKG